MPPNTRRLPIDYWAQSQSNIVEREELKAPLANPSEAPARADNRCCLPSKQLPSPIFFPFNRSLSLQHSDKRFLRKLRLFAVFDQPYGVYSPIPFIGHTGRLKPSSPAR
jgi:hypothetical protein